jgi:hypothetical protein
MIVVGRSQKRESREQKTQIVVSGSLEANRKSQIKDAK